MYKVMFVFLLLVFLPMSIFSSTSISQCTEINSSYSFDTDRTIVFNQNITSNDSSCIVFDTISNVTIDCNNYFLIGNTSNSRGFDLSRPNIDNISIHNCNIEDFNSGIHVQSQLDLLLSIQNITLNNISGSTGFPVSAPMYFSIVSLTNESVVRNITIYNSEEVAVTLDSVILFMEDVIIINSTGYGIFVQGSSINLSNFTIEKTQSDGIRLRLIDNSNFDSITIRNVDSGFFIVDAVNTTINNTYVSNSSSYGIEFVGFTSSNYENIIVSNTEIRDSQRGFGVPVNTDTSSEVYIYGNTFVNNTNYNLFIPTETYPGLDIYIYNNTLGNISKIDVPSSTSNSIYFNLSSMGNTYYNTSIYSGIYCFEATICDNQAQVTLFPVVSQVLEQATSSLFPFTSIISLLLVIMYFLF